jgi:hypothetical protein
MEAVTVEPKVQALGELLDVIETSVPVTFPV